MKKSYVVVVIIFFSVLFYLYKVRKSDTALSHMSKPVIVCTTSIIADTVKNLVGELCEVVSIMGPGIDPHLYKASSGDAYRINSADIIFYNGLHLEGKMGDIFESIKNQNKSIYAVSEGVPEYLLIRTEYDNIFDPHIWHDVNLWRYVFNYVASILKKHYPDYQDIIEKNRSDYVEILEELDFFVYQRLSEIKYAKILITSHDAFSYFSKRYNIPCYAVQGISTDSEPSIEDNEKILNILLDNDIKTIFIEQTVCENYLRNIQSIMEMKGKKVNIGSKLYSDALGEKNGNTYIQMIKENINAITEGLNDYEQ